MESWLIFLALACFFIIALVYIVSPLFIPKSFPLNRKHVLVTGGSSGIGKAVAEEAVRQGASVTLLARNQVKLAAAQEEIKKLIIYPETQNVICVSVDLTKEYNAVQKAIAQAEEMNGGVDVLINCAGYAHPGTFEDITPEEFKVQMDANYLSGVFATKAVLCGMKQRGGGRIAFTSSQGGQIGFYGYTAYAASKMALRGLAEALQMEVKPYNIRVTLCFPPDTDTPGFTTENLTKPKETAMLSETVGLYSPDFVAKKMVESIVAGHYQCYIGMDGWMLSCVTAGMCPVTSLTEALQHILLSGLFRGIGLLYLCHFDRIILRCKQEKEAQKQDETKTS